MKACRVWQRILDFQLLVFSTADLDADVAELAFEPEDWDEDAVE